MRPVSRITSAPQACTTIGDGAEAEHAEHGKQQGNADARSLQHGDDGAGAHHVGGVEDVDGGDHARAPVHRRPRLHGRERRHDVEAAGDGQAAQARRAAPGREPEAMQLGRTDRAARPASRPTAIQAIASANTPISTAPSGTSARFGCAVAGARRQHRADGDADREDGEARRHHAFAAADAVLDQGRQQRQRHEADQPEPRDDVRAAPQAPVGLQLAQQRDRRGPGIAGDGEVGRGRAGVGDGAREQPGADGQRQDDARPRCSGLLASATAMPPAMVPIRMARKVAPSTSALPAGSSAVSSFSGRMPYLTGPNSAATMPNRPSVTNRIGTECRKKPRAARPAIGISASLMRSATQRLVVAVGQLAAERREDEERRDEDDARERDQRRRVPARDARPRRRARTGSACRARS